MTELEFCLCGHSKACHNSGKIPLCSYDNGFYICPCSGFRSESENTNTAKVRLRATNGIDEEEVTKI